MITIALTSVAATLLGLQSSGETAVAIKNDNPETWSVEYPRLIAPYVADYRNCLGFTNRLLQGVADFEAQHRSDVPRCSDVRKEAVAQSVEALAGAKTTLSEAEIEDLFNAIAKVHINRGRDLDQQFSMRMQAIERDKTEYGIEDRSPLVISLDDPTVVKSKPTDTPQVQPANAGQPQKVGK